MLTVVDQSQRSVGGQKRDGISKEKSLVLQSAGLGLMTYGDVTEAHLVEP